MMEGNDIYVNQNKDIVLHGKFAGNLPYLVENHHNAFHVQKQEQD